MVDIVGGVLQEGVVSNGWSHGEPHVAVEAHCSGSSVLTFHTLCRDSCNQTPTNPCVGEQLGYMQHTKRWRPDIMQHQPPLSNTLRMCMPMQHGSFAVDIVTLKRR
jgi:hypothetical protein